MVLRFGLNVINAYSPGFILELAESAEKAGWEGFFLWDHILFPWPAPLADPWVVLGAIAAKTRRIRIGTAVTPLPRRRPHKVARETATLDVITGGRAVLGVGLGGDEGEFTRFGEEASTRARAEKLDEALELITALWSGREVNHRGVHYEASGVTFLPKPIQEPRIPIWVGGVSGAALRRARKWDGWLPVGPASAGGFPGTTIQELPEMIRYINGDRMGSPAEIVYTMDVPEAGEKRRSDLALLEGMGVDWVLDHIYGLRYSQEQAIDWVSKGPPNMASSV